MIRTSKRRKKRRSTRRVPFKGALAASPREPMARSVPSGTPGEGTSSARLALVEVAAAPVAEADGVPPIALATRLNSAELLAEAASVSTTEPPAEVADVARFARIYEQAATTTTTRRLYLNRLSLFFAWCAARGNSAMPAHPEVLRLYLVSLATKQKALSTLDVSLAAIVMAHRALGYEPPMSDELRVTLRSLRSALGPRSTRPTPISLEMLREIVTPCGQDPLATRDRALILVTYFAGLRRAEAVGLNREGTHREERGYGLTLGSTEPPPTETPTRLTLHAELDLCPVRALDGWLAVRAAWARGPDLSPARGPLFVALHRARHQRLHLGDRLGPRDVDRILKRRAAAAGLNPAGLSAASLRAGFYAESARGGASPEEMGEHGALGTTPRPVRAAETLAPPTPPRSPT